MKVDLASYLRGNSIEDFRGLMAAAKTPLELDLEQIRKNPEDQDLRNKITEKLAKLPGPERDHCTEKLYEALKPLSVRKKTILQEIEAKIKRTRFPKGTPSASDELVQLVKDKVYLFHDENREAFVSYQIDGHREIWPVNSRSFELWLTREYYRDTQQSPTVEALKQTKSLMEAIALFDGPEHRLHLRVAKHDGEIWYDLANEDWQAVKITPEGWEVVDEPPILFRRYGNTTAQVLPQRGGSMKPLQDFLNLKDGDDWVLVDALVASALIPEIPHAVPIFYGDKGSAKSTAQRVLRRLIDPAAQELMLLPESKMELALVFKTNYAPCFDNLDGLKPWQSNMLCTAVTGGGMSKRRLYTDESEVFLSFRRVPMLNGINLVATRDDLLDRTLLFELVRISEDDRMEEQVFWQEFEQERPFILGALFDAIAGAMRLYPQINLRQLPRMADFARWGCAISQALGYREDQFLMSYQRNLLGGVEAAVEADLVAAAILEFAKDRPAWEGTPTKLLEELNKLPSTNQNAKGWPKVPHSLTRRVNKIKSALADMGITVDTSRGKKREVRITYGVDEIASKATKASTELNYREPPEECPNGGFSFLYDERDYSEDALESGFEEPPSLAEH